MKAIKTFTLLTASTMLMAGSVFAVGPVGKTWVGATGGLEQYDEDLDDGAFGTIDANVSLAPNFDVFGGTGFATADGPGVEVEGTQSEVGLRLVLDGGGAIVPYAEAALLYQDAEVELDDGTKEDDDDVGFGAGAGLQFSPCAWSTVQVGVAYADIFDDDSTAVEAAVGAELGQNFQLWVGGAYDIDDETTTETLSLNLLF
jgi:opacity protein-like surface antigen